MDKPRIGVLALQGSFELHQWHLESLGANYVPVLHAQDLQKIDGLILPGGESGVMLKLLDTLSLRENLAEFLKQKPAWGICAGAILMAKSVLNPAQYSFGALDIEIERNAYGRQKESSIEMIEGYEVSYIRAPRIVNVSNNVEILSTRESAAVWVKQGKCMATAFHPETNRTRPSPWHEKFLEMCLIN